MMVILICIFAFFFMAGAPIFAILGGITVVLFHFLGQNIALIMGDAFRISAAPALVALPLFIFSGYYLAESNIAERMLTFLESLTGWMRGGVCLSVIIAAAVFTAFTGASAVTIVAFGGLVIPMLEKRGYSENLSVGLMTISGSSGILFPPCIAVLLYGIIARTSIQGLYIAGLLPALLFIGLQFSYCGYRSYKENIITTPFSFWESIQAIRGIKWELPLFLFIVIGIFSGLITVAEGAVVTAAYVVIVEGIILKEVKWNRVPHIARDSMMMLGAIFFILAVAFSFTNYLIYQEVPQRLLESMKVIFTNKWTFLIGLNLFLLIVGMMMDIFSAILVVVPLILPIAMYYDIDPIHLGIIFLSNLELGYITPPIGISLFIASLRFRKPVLHILKGVLPFFFLGIIYLILVTYCPFISLWLVKLFNIPRDLVFM